MPAISIGVHVHAEPERLRATLASLAAHTPQPHSLLVLGDGPDAPTAAVLDNLGAIAQSSTLAPLGAPACFNRLVRASPAEIYVLLESGARVAPEWLSTLLASFEDHPHAGLAGPSTNCAWNDQCAFPRVRDSDEEIARIAEEARRKFGRICRTLEPLFSLSDFCYVVKREVIDAIGEADEGYGLGPCWEMDYNIRAARAGFAGLWVCGAYVHRSPFTARRRQEEDARFEASKRRYQDKFCGLRLSGAKTDYRNHCRGDACPNFAPAAAIRTIPANPAAVSVKEWPLVSCIMPTYDRRIFIPRSLRSFFSQDYPNLELIVVDDGPPIADLFPSDERIRYHRLPEKLTIGAKRNYACEQARGRFIVHWDDDDWYSPARVRRQIVPLLETKAQVSGTSAVFFYNHEKDQAFRYQYRGTICAWMGGLAYSKSLWESHSFEPIQVAEDVKFLAHVPPELRCDLLDPALYVAAIHAANASPKITSGAFWTPEAAETIRAILGREVSLSCPLVSCIMPTYNRRAFIPLSLACFQEQTYPNAELVVVDDGDDAVGDLLEKVPRIRYIRVNHKLHIGAKRNLACEQARGEYIAHWDDDDWYAPDRLARQLEPLRAETHDITGLVNTYMLQMPPGRFWTTSESVHRRMFVGDLHGGTLVYRRALWQNGIRYPEVNLAEDAMFIRRATEQQRRIERLANPGLFVYMRHGRNTWKFESGQFLDPQGWLPASAPPGFSFALIEAYRSACLSATA
jgi:glycosyltransferase involved in cell wall biosynthesis